MKPMDIRTVLSALLLGIGTVVVAAEKHDHGHHEEEMAAVAGQHDADNDNHHDGDEEDHDHSHESDKHEEGVTLNSGQKALANIKATALEPTIMDYQVYAPAEIKANGYTSYLVSPRVDSVVLRRHVALGDHVEQGQALVTLFSETVAQAQAAFRVASSEWQRVAQLGRKTVGDKRFVAAQTDYEATYGRLLAFGLAEQAIQSLRQKSQAFGEYTLIAPGAGAVLSDDFSQGQRVESGQALMELADEHELWVEARLAPNAQLTLPVGFEAQVQVGADRFSAKVTQTAHTIDAQTRTRVVRLLVNNEAHRLHPGQFADVYFSFATAAPVLAVPESALMRSTDGDWMVFVEQAPGQFVEQEVELGRALGHWREIIGIAAGTRVVIEGAFFVASEMAKGGFDPHNH